MRLAEEAEGLDWDSILVDVEGDLPETWKGRADERLDEAVIEEWGPDGGQAHLCAWYVSFHWKDPLWGIHLLEPCWHAITQRFWRHQPPNSFPAPREAARAAFFYLFDHELYHYASDVAASMLEIARGRADVYVPHHFNVYCKTYGTGDCTEEALAHRYAYERYETMRVDRKYLFWVLRNSPPGYREFQHYLGANFWTGRRRSMNEYLAGSPNPRSTHPLEQVIELVAQDAYSAGHRIPIYLRIPPGRVQRIFPRF